MAFLLAFLLAQGFVHRSNPPPGGAAQNMTAVGLTPQTGCTTLNTGGSATALIKITGTFVGTVSFLYSNDGWVTNGALVGYLYDTTNATVTTSTTTTTTVGTWVIPLDGQREIGACVSAYTSGTVSASVDADPAAIVVVVQRPIASITTGTGVACNSGTSPCTVTNSAQNVLSANPVRKACSLQAVGAVDLYCKRATAAGSAASASSFDFLLTAGSGALKGGGTWVCHDSGVVWTGPVNCIASGASAVVDLAVAETN